MTRTVRHLKKAYWSTTYAIRSSRSSSENGKEVHRARIGIFTPAAATFTRRPARKAGAASFTLFSTSTIHAGRPKSAHGGFRVRKEDEDVGERYRNKHIDLHGPPYVVGNRVYCPWSSAGLVILDISDISKPKKISQLDVNPPARQSHRASHRRSIAQSEPLDHQQRSVARTLRRAGEFCRHCGHI